jgi:hypothetical protein
VIVHRLNVYLWVAFAKYFQRLNKTADLPVFSTVVVPMKKKKGIPKQ